MAEMPALIASKDLQLLDFSDSVPSIKIGTMIDWQNLVFSLSCRI